MRVKTLEGAVTLTEPNSVTAILATTEVVDQDGDIVTTGAIIPGPVVISGWGHASWQPGAMNLPIGRGTINEVGNKLILTGTFFETSLARETKETISALGDLAEWSWSLHDYKTEPVQIGGRIVRRINRVRVYEASPVLVGASVGSRTVELRSAGLSAAERAELRSIAARVSSGMSRSDALAIARRWGIR